MAQETEQNPHSIFSTEEDRWSWDKYVEQCDLIELSDADKSRAKDAIQYLRDVLGEGFLRRACDQHSPFFHWHFADASPRARLSLIEFAETVKVFLESSNFNKLLQRIKKPVDADDLIEKLSVINVARKFSRVGFDVEFDPAVMVTDRHGVQRGKMPDLKVVDRENGQAMYVEVSRLKAGAKQNLIDRTYLVIWDVIHQAMLTDPEAWKDITRSRHLLPYALIHKGMDDEELREVVGAINSLVAQVKADGKFAELIIEGVIEVCVASYDDHDRAREWAAVRDMDNDLVMSPVINTDEVVRAKVKLDDKLEQLPDDTPGIVVIVATGNLIFLTHDLEYIVAGLERDVCNHPKLLCAVALHAFSDGSEDRIEITDVGLHTLINRVEDGTVEQTLIVVNEACDKAMAADERLTRVRQAFAQAGI